MSCTQTADRSLVYVSVVQGDSLALAVDLGSQGGDVDVAGWTFASEVRDPGGALAATFAVAVTDAAAGVLSLALTPAETAAMPAADYAWDLQGEDAGGGVKTLVRGALRVRPGVTQ